MVNIQFTKATKEQMQRGENIPRARLLELFKHLQVNFIEALKGNFDFRLIICDFCLLWRFSYCLSKTGFKVGILIPEMIWFVK